MEPIHFVRKTLFGRLKVYLFILFLLLIGRFFVKHLTLKFPELFFGNEPVIYQILTCCSFFVITNALIKASEGLFSETNLKDRISVGLNNFLQKLLRVFLYTLALLLSLEHFGISVTPILASLGVGSIAVALALQDTLGNIFSGFYLLVDQPFQVGHLIRVDTGIEGRVLSVGWRSTQILMGSGHLLVLPNSKLSTSQLVNMSLPTPESLVQVKFSVNVNQDLEKIEALSLAVICRIQNEFYPFKNEEFIPSVRFQDVVLSSVEVLLTVKSKDETMVSPMKHALIKSLIHELTKNEVKLRLR